MVTSYGRLKICICGVLEPLWAYICPMSVTICVYVSNAFHYRRIFVQFLSLSAYICPIPITIGVYLSIVCHYWRIFVQCLCKITKQHNSKCVSMIWNSSPDLPDLPAVPAVPEVSHLLPFGTSSTRAGGQDDVSSNQLPQINLLGLSN